MEAHTRASGLADLISEMGRGMSSGQMDHSMKGTGSTIKLLDMGE